jgi:hypothetical protein
VSTKPAAAQEQIIGVLKEAEASAKTGDLARRHGIRVTGFANAD